MASTAWTATFLYSLAVQQAQATSFVTDNYNLDMQWLNTVDQPLLDEAEYWSERATAEASTKPEQAIEDNTQASMALQIAAEVPSSRQDMSVTNHNADTGNPTQISVYADGDGSTIHDVGGGIGGYIEAAISTVLDIAAVVTGQPYLYFAAAAIDAAEAGQAFSNGQDIQGILSLAQAVAAGINGGVGGTTPTVPLTSAQVTAEVINTAVQGVGGVYGVVQSAENGNGLGILASALEAAGAGAAGIALDASGTTQTTLNAIAAGLGTAGVAASVASAFDSGNLGQGLVDSLNLCLPAVASAYVNAQSGQAAVQIDSAAFAAGGTNPAPNIDIPDFGSALAAAENAPTSLPSGNGSSGVTVAIAPVGAGGEANVSNTMGSGGTSAVITQSGQTHVVAATPTSSSDTIQTTSSSIVADVMSFLGYINPIGSAESGTDRDRGSTRQRYIATTDIVYKSRPPLPEWSGFSLDNDHRDICLQTKFGIF